VFCIYPNTFHLTRSLVMFLIATQNPCFLKNHVVLELIFFIINLRNSLFRPGAWTLEPRGGEMTRRYETIFITPADIPDEELQALIERYCAIITSRKGLLVKVEKWGKRKLAYEIKRQLRGYYVLLDFAGQTDIVNEMERNFKIDDKVLKYMTVKTDEVVDLKALEGELKTAGESKKEGSDVPAADSGNEVAGSDSAPAGAPASSGE